MKMIDSKDLLLEYSKELFGTNDKDEPWSVLTIEGLIESHRNLRNLNMEHESYRREAIKEGREFGYRQGADQVNSEFIKLNDLKKMTLQEISEILVEGD